MTNIQLRLDANKPIADEAGEIIIIEKPDSEALTKTANDLLDSVRDLTIDCGEMYEIASEETKEIKTRKKALEDRRKTITAPLDEAKKNVMDLFRMPIVILTEAETVIKGKMIAYSNEQKAVAVAAQKKAEEAARAERQRMLEEAQKAEAEQKRLLAEAEQNPEKAVELQRLAEEKAAQSNASALSAAMVTTQVPAVQVPKAKGASERVTWSAEVYDLPALLQFILDNPQYQHFIQPNMKELRAHAISMKENMKIPGVRAVGLSGLAIRS